MGRDQKIADVVKTDRSDRSRATALADESTFMYICGSSPDGGRNVNLEMVLDREVTGR